jgi:hypothetical protein
VLAKVVEGTSTAAGARIALVDVHAVIAAARDDEEPCVSPADGHHLTPAGHGLYASLLMTAARASVPPPAASTVDWSEDRPVKLQ